MAKKRKNKNKKNKNKNLFFPNNYEKENNFFWITTNFKSILKNICNIKNIIPTKEEIEFLNEKINTLEKEINHNKQTIFINPLFKIIIDSMKVKKIALTDKSLNIQKIISNFTPEKTFYIKDIKDEYLKKYNEKLSNKKIYNIIKYSLKYRFKRTSIKNNKILSKENLIMSFLFYKTILRGILLGLDLIFIDESGFQLHNNKYSRWRLKEQEYPYGPKNNDLIKINFILAISYNEIIHYQINEKNTDSQLFREFVKELIKKIPEESKKNKLVIMDNAKFHLTKEVREIFEDSKLKVITISPYNSDQNMIELIFRHIKNITKRINFKSIYKLKKKIIEILEKEEIKETLKKLYKRTLIYYKNFINKNNNIEKLEHDFKEVF